MIRRLAKCIKGYTKETILTPIFVCLEVILEVIIPFIMAELIDKGIDAGNMNVILTYGGSLLVCAAFALVFGVLAGRTAAIASSGFAKNLRSQMFYNVQTFSFSNIDKFSTGSIVTRLTTDVTNVQMAFQMLTRMAIRSPLMLIFSLIAAMKIDMSLSFIFLGCVPVLAIGLALIIKSAFPLFDKVFKKYDHLNNIVQENLHGIRVVKSFVREKEEIEKFSEISQEINKLFTKAEKLLAFNMPLMQFCTYSCMILISWFGARAIVACGGDAMLGLSTGELMGLMTYVMQILMSLMILSMVFVMLTIASASARRTYEILVEESDIQNPAEPVRSIDNGEIIFENVSFSYGGTGCAAEELRTGQSGQGAESSAASGQIGQGAESSAASGQSGQGAESSAASSQSGQGAESSAAGCAAEDGKNVLENINIRIASGETVGILGGTGSSKTTLVQLIARLYDVKSGRVLVGGRDVRDYDLEALREQVAVVLQKNVLFSGTVAENLRWGDENATDEELISAAKIAQAHSFISEFPEKYDKYIEQGGTNVSGGQRQRLSIARALLKKPKILILDDSTSAVDTATDAAIREGLRNSLPETTKLIIAQRVASVQDADKIVVMDEGRIVDMGSHKQLLDSCEIYKEIYYSQQKGGEADE